MLRKHLDDPLYMDSFIINVLITKSATQGSINVVQPLMIVFAGVSS